MSYYTFQLCIKLIRWLCHPMHPLARFAGLTLKGSVSLISRSPAAPYEISSLATPEGAARYKPAALSIGIPHPRGELPSAKGAYVCVICDFLVQSL